MVQSECRTVPDSSSVVEVTAQGAARQTPRVQQGLRSWSPGADESCTCVMCPGSLPAETFPVLCAAVRCSGSGRSGFVCLFDVFSSGFANMFLSVVGWCLCCQSSRPDRHLSPLSWEPETGGPRELGFIPISSRHARTALLGGARVRGRGAACEPPTGLGEEET